MEPTAQVVASTRLTIDVWADVLCPWCYIGEQRLSTAIERSAHTDDIELKIHTYELVPAGTTQVTPTVQRLAETYGSRPPRPGAMEEGVAEQAAAEGLTYKVDRPASNTFDLLRLVHLGAEYGLSGGYLRAMQAEVVSGNPDAFEHTTLIRTGEQLGIPAGEIRGHRNGRLLRRRNRCLRGPGRPGTAGRPAASGRN